MCEGPPGGRRRPTGARTRLSRDAPITLTDTKQTVFKPDYLWKNIHQSFHFSLFGITYHTYLICLFFYRSEAWYTSSSKYYQRNINCNAIIISVSFYFHRSNRSLLRVYVIACWTVTGLELSWLVFINVQIIISYCPYDHVYQRSTCFYVNKN